MKFRYSVSPTCEDIAAALGISESQVTLREYANGDIEVELPDDLNATQQAKLDVAMQMRKFRDKRT